MPENHPTLRLAVAQSTVREDPTDADALRETAAELRDLMRQAHAAGARLVHFTEGATCFPSKYVMSESGPEQVGPADWSRFRWDVLREELAAIAALARELKLWTVLGSVHRLTPPARPHNSLYVISDQGTVATRYDERALSHTKRTYMYSPGTSAVTFDLDGYKFGLSLGMDSHFPEMFAQYEQLEVDAVLASTTGFNGGTAAADAETRGHAAVNAYWVSLAVPAQHAPVTPSGVADPHGAWAAAATTEPVPAIAVFDLHREDRISPLARAWRRETLQALPDQPLVLQDTRSTTRTGF